jgi:hypothetical protein
VSAYAVSADERPESLRRPDDHQVRLANAETAREASRIVQHSGSDLSPTNGSQTRQVAEYLIRSWGLRRVLVRDQLASRSAGSPPTRPPPLTQRGPEGRIRRGRAGRGYLILPPTE